MQSLPLLREVASIHLPEMGCLARSRKERNVDLLRKPISALHLSEST